MTLLYDTVLKTIKSAFVRIKTSRYNDLKQQSFNLIFLIFPDLSMI